VIFQSSLLHLASLFDMGVKQSTPFPFEAVADCVVRTVNAFGPTYVKAVAISSVEAASHAAAKGSEYALQRPPLASEPLEVGWLTKLGERTKNWKRRWFILGEEKDNFVLFYYGEERGGAADRAGAKGAIFLCGYVVADAPEHGPHCLSLSPLDRKRTWLLRADTEPQKDKWKLALRFAALKCQPPISTDRILAKAFREAYARTRRQLGITGPYAIDRSEPEQLAVLCVQACEETVLHDTYVELYASIAATSAGSPQQSPELEHLGREVDRVAQEVVASAWPALSTRVEMRRDFIQRQVEGSVAALQTERASRLADVRVRLAPVLAEVTADATTQSRLMAVQSALSKVQYKVKWARVCCSGGACVLGGGC
jgi:hypothetical protein